MKRHACAPRAVFAALADSDEDNVLDAVRAQLATLDGVLVCARSRRAASG
jgi:hypothetical protein